LPVTNKFINKAGHSGESRNPEKLEKRLDSRLNPYLQVVGRETAGMTEI
jgi:hypothetical protein